MAKLNITKTELVWPGKYDEHGARREVARVKNLPFQVIESINESRATREARNSRGGGGRERSLMFIKERRAARLRRAGRTN